MVKAHGRQQVTRCSKCVLLHAPALPCLPPLQAETRKAAEAERSGAPYLYQSSLPGPVDAGARVALVPT